MSTDPARSAQGATARLVLYLVLPAAVVGVALYFLAAAQKQAALRRWVERLDEVAEHQAELVETWWRERLGDAAVLEGSLTLRRFLDEPSNLSRRADLLERLDAVQQAYDYRSLHVLTADSTSLLASSGAAALTLRERELVAMALATGETQTAIHSCESGRPALSFVRPLPQHVAEADPAAPRALLFEVDPEAHLFPAVTGGIAGTASGESLLAVATAEGGLLYFSSPLKRPRSTSLSLDAAAARGLPALAALRGQHQAREARDYAQDPAIAAAVPIPSLGWALVRKIDLSEALAAYVRLLALQATISGTLVLGLAAALAAFRQRRRAAILAHALEKSGLQAHVAEADRRAARLAHLLDEAEEEIYVFDPVTLACIQANRQAAAAQGLSSEELTRRSLPEIVVSLDRQQVDALLMQLRSGESQRTTLAAEHRRPDGTRYPVDLRLAHVTSGAAPVLVAIASDATTRRGMENQLRQLQKMEAIGRLAGGVAHDFNNILTVIGASAELALGQLEPTHPAARELNEIADSTRRAAELTGQLLAFGRRQIVKAEPRDINRLVQELHPLLRRMIGANVEISVHLEQGLGSVLIDRSQFEQLVTNLALNARDAMPGGGRLTIETQAVELDQDYARGHLSIEPGPHVLLAVTDTGEGMDEATKGRVFEPFFTTKMMGKGTGLGLATVYGIVQQCSGCIWIYSEPGEGTTFKVYFPQSSRPAVTDVAQDPVRAARRPATETVLVVEDEASVRSLAARILEAEGHRVLVASNGDEALRVARDHAGAIDLLLTDVVMPRMSGKGVAERLHVSRPSLRVLYMSGFTDNAIVHHGILDEDTAFLQKPFTPKSLAAAVREALDRS